MTEVQIDDRRDSPQARKNWSWGGGKQSEQPYTGERAGGVIHLREGMKSSADTTNTPFTRVPSRATFG